MCIFSSIITVLVITNISKKFLYLGGSVVHLQVQLRVETFSVEGNLFFPFVCSFVRLFVCSFVRLFVCSFVRLFICSFVHLFVCIFVRLFVVCSSFVLPLFVRRLFVVCSSFVRLFICQFVHFLVCSFVRLFVLSKRSWCIL